LLDIKLFEAFFVIVEVEYFFLTSPELKPQLLLPLSSLRSIGNPMQYVLLSISAEIKWPRHGKAETINSYLTSV
jgi:hypothetical protein